MDRYLPLLSERGKRWARFFALLAAIALLVWIALALRAVLTPIVAALALAYILDPAVTWLEKNYKIKRVTSISIGLGLLLLVGISLLVVGTAQVVELAGNTPDYTRKALRWLDETIPGLFTSGADAVPTDTPPQVSEQTGQPSLPLTTQPIVGTEQAPPSAAGELAGTGPDRLIELAAQHGLSIGRAVISYIARLVSNAFYWLSLTVLLPLYTFFFLLRFNDIVEAVRDHLPSDYRPTIVRVVSTIDGAVSSFFRGRLLVCLVVGTLTGIGWSLVGVPYPLPLGALAGTLNLVPFMSVLALPPALILTYLKATDADANWVGPVILVLVVYLAVQAIESFVLTPVIESKASGLHPLTTVIALLIGGQLAGLLGMLLAIPITSTLKSLAVEYALPEIRRLAEAKEAGPPDVPDGLAKSASDAPTDQATTSEAAKRGTVTPRDKP